MLDISRVPSDHIDIELLIFSSFTFTWFCFTVRLNEVYREIEGLMVQMFHPVYLTDKFSIPPDSISSLEEARWVGLVDAHPSPAAWCLLTNLTLLYLEQCRALAEAWSPFIMISYSTVAEYCAKRWKVSLLNKPSLPPLVQYQQPKTQVPTLEFDTPFAISLSLTIHNMPYSRCSQRIQAKFLIRPRRSF